MIDVMRIIQYIFFALIGLVVIGIVEFLFELTIVGIFQFFLYLTGPIRRIVASIVWIPSIEKYIKIFIVKKSNSVLDLSAPINSKQWERFKLILFSKDHTYNIEEVSNLPNYIKSQLLFTLKNDPLVKTPHFSGLSRISEIVDRANKSDYEKITFYLNSNLWGVYDYSHRYKKCIRKIQKPLELYLSPQSFAQNSKEWIFHFNMKRFRRYMEKNIFNDVIERKRRIELEKNIEFIYPEEKFLKINDEVFVKFEGAYYMGDIVKISDDFWNTKIATVILKKSIIKRDYEDEEKLKNRIYRVYQNSLSSRKLELETIDIPEILKVILCTDIFLINKKKKW
jgi:hypothetical protein